MYLELSDLTLLFAVGTIFAIWWRQLKNRTQALQAIKNHCEQLELQLLDETLIQRSLRFRKMENGKRYLVRAYEFEFAVSGAKRYKGIGYFSSGRSLGFELDAYEITRQDDLDQSHEYH